MLSGADEISLGIGFLGRAADESAGDFTAEFADLSVDGLPLDHEHLADMREVGAVVQFVRCRNVVRLNAAVIPLPICVNPDAWLLRRLKWNSMSSRSVVT